MRKPQLKRKTWICPYCGKWRWIQDADFHLVLHRKSDRNLFAALEDPKEPEFLPQTTLLDFVEVRINPIMSTFDDATRLLRYLR